MKKLTADEFAAKVMSTGTELEVDELRTSISRNTGSVGRLACVSGGELNSEAGFAVMMA